MIEKVLEYSKIGTKSQILYIIHLLSNGELIKNELYRACASKEYTYSSSFDGVISFLSWLGIIKDDGAISLSTKLTEKNFLQEITLLIITKLLNEKKIHNIFNNRNIMYIREQDTIVIKNNLINLDYSAFRNLFINIGLFVNDNLVQSQLLINEEFSGWFLKVIIPLIDEQQSRGMSLNDLDILQIKQKKIGFEAELFVLKYEKKIRANHPKNENIQIISELNVSAGYDIVSYETDKSILLDKFIEVKSFSGTESFFWSRNEIDVAKVKENKYFLYLVDRLKMNNENYIPTIIQNPYENVLNTDKWKKRIEKYFVTI